VSEWVPISLWGECGSMQRPGYVFEVRNSTGNTLLTRCTPTLPQPFDWKSPAVEFRLIPEPQPRHSTPIPEPRR
jgi:hypothetical protein